jgi:hypothetical protein
VRQGKTTAGRSATKDKPLGVRVLAQVSQNPGTLKEKARSVQMEQEAESGAVAASSTVGRSHGVCIRLFQTDKGSHRATRFASALIRRAELKEK